MPSTTPVALDRRFSAWVETDPAALDVELMRGHEQDVGWPAILKKPRVVILAEAGAGKSTEMKAQADRLRNWTGLRSPPRFKTLAITACERP